MKEIVNLITISPYLSTSYHLLEFNSALDRLEKTFFQSQKPTTAIDSEIPFPLSEYFKKLAVEHGANLDNIEEATEFINKVRSALRVIKPLTLTLGIQPTLDMIKDINSWIITNLKQVVALDFVFDPGIIAGAKVEFDGKIQDFSIKKEVLDNIKITTDQIQQQTAVN